MPDEKLVELAEQGKLHDAEVLQQQVARMLRSPTNRRGLRSGAKVRDFATSFVEQWLGTRELGREFKPDPKIAGRYIQAIDFVINRRTEVDTVTDHGDVKGSVKHLAILEVVRF